MEGSTSTVVVAGETADASVQLNYTAGGLNVDVILPSVDNPVVLGPQRIKEDGHFKYEYDSNGYIIKKQSMPRAWDNLIEEFTTDPDTGLRISSKYYEYDFISEDYELVGSAVISHDSKNREVEYIRTNTDGLIVKISAEYDDTNNTVKYTETFDNEGDGIVDYTSVCVFDSLGRVVEFSNMWSDLWGYNGFYIVNALGTTKILYEGDTNLVKREEMYDNTGTLSLVADYDITSTGYYAYAKITYANGSYYDDIVFGPMFNYGDGFAQSASLTRNTSGIGNRVIVYRADLKVCQTSDWEVVYENGNAAPGCIPGKLEWEPLVSFFFL